MYQNDHIGSQPIQLNFKFSSAVAAVICLALVLTRKVISVNSDGNKMVDIILVKVYVIVIVLVNSIVIVIVLALVNVIVLALVIAINYFLLVLAKPLL